MTPVRRSIILAVAAVAILAARPVSAQEERVNLYHKFEFSPSLELIRASYIRVDSEDGSVGTDVDAEDDLGLEKVKWEPRFDFRWRPGRKHEIEVGYQFARRDAEKSIERTIDFADTTFDAGVALHTHLKTDLAFLNYRFAIIAKDHTQAGLALGTGALLRETGLEALASAGSSEVTYSASQKFTVPLGSLGIYGRFVLTDVWTAEADARIVKFKVSRFDIQYTELGAAVRYFASPKLGFEFGGGIDAVKVDIDPREDATKVRPSARIKYSLANVRLGVVLAR
jgi:hypothetical protein